MFFCGLKVLFLFYLMINEIGIEGLQLYGFNFGCGGFNVNYMIILVGENEGWNVV